MARRRTGIIQLPGTIASKRPVACSVSSIVGHVRLISWNALRPCPINLYIHFV